MPVIKPPGMTSHDVVAFARRLLGTKEIGHAGTLDPDAAGVLLLLVGRATKLLPFLHEVPKGYRAEMAFGISTDTMDASGTVTTISRDFEIPRDRLVGTLPRFTGEIRQVPPMVSALHYKGKRLYELAREGKSVELPPRAVRILRLAVFDWGSAGECIGPGDAIILDIRCSSGTYIRSLVHDLGQELGCGAHLSFLVRTESAGFRLEQSFALEELERLARLGMIAQALSPLSAALGHLPDVALNESEARAAVHGSPIRLEEGDERARDLRDSARVRLSFNGEVVAISRAVRTPPGVLMRPERVLYQGSEGF